MKILSLIFFLVMCASSNQLVGQNITARYENKTLAAVLEDLGNRYEISFAYDSDALADRVGSWSFENASIEMVLQQLFEPHQLAWKEVNGTLVVYSLDSNIDQSATNNAMDSNQLYGEIRDRKSNELLPFALLTSPDGSQTTNTNADGKFVMNREGLTDSLLVYYVGYDRKAIAMADLQSDSYFIFYLTARSAYLPMVMIEGKKNQLMMSGNLPSVHTINPNNINGIIGGGEPDIYRAVQMLPGVAGALESNNGLFVRGGNSDQTLITYDGFTLYQQDHFFGAFSAINATSVKNMRIHKGAMEARFGGRVAGVLEIVGKDGNTEKPIVQIDASPLSMAAMIETPMDKEGKATAVIAGRRSFTNTVFSPTYKNMFNTVYNAAVNVQPNQSAQTFNSTNDPEFYFQDMNAKLSYRSSPKDVVSLSLFASKDKLYMQYADTASYEVINLRDVNYTDESVKQSMGGGLRWVHNWRSNWSSLLSVGYSRFSGNYFSVDTLRELLFQDTTVMFYAENAELNDLDARAEVNYTGVKHRLQMGFQVNHLSTFNGLNYMGISNPSRSQSGGVYSVYLQDEWNANERLTLRPGLRFNYFNLENRVDQEPRLAANYKAIPNRMQLKASAGIIHQYIHRIREQSIYFNTPDYWQFSGSQNLPTLRAVQYVVGGIGTFKNWTLDVEGYLKHNSGLFVNAGIYGRTDSARYQSEILTGKGSTYGLDLLLQRDAGAHNAWLSYSLIYNNNEFHTDDGLRMIREPYLRQHEAKLYYEYKPKRWSLSAFFVVGSGKPFTPYLGKYNYDLPNGTQRTLPIFGDLNSGLLQPYHRLDLSAAYHFSLKKSKGKLQLSAFNVYNQKNVRDIQYIAVRSNTNNDDYEVVERKVNMLPFLPSINLQLQF